MADWIVEPLNKGHDRADFSCGRVSLDDYLKKYASQYARRKLGTTYVAVLGGQPRVLGFYTLAPSHLAFAHAPAELLKGLPKHPVPSLLLARLAVTQAERGKGLGQFLLLDAFDRCLRDRARGCLSSDRSGGNRRSGRRVLRQVRISGVPQRSPSSGHRGGDRRGSRQRLSPPGRLSARQCGLSIIPTHSSDRPQAILSLAAAEAPQGRRSLGHGIHLDAFLAESATASSVPAFATAATSPSRWISTASKAAGLRGLLPVYEGPTAGSSGNSASLAEVSLPQHP